MAKYEINYSCGHTATVQLYGPTKERERKIAWFEREGLCPECYAAQKDAENAAGCSERVMLYREYKQDWSWLKTKRGSYDAESKTVTVYFPAAYTGLEDWIEKIREIRRRATIWETRAEIAPALREALDAGKITREQVKILLNEIVWDIE